MKVNVFLAAQTVCLLTACLGAPSALWTKGKAENSLYSGSALSPAEVIQVTGPPPDYGPIIHTEILAEHVFANSVSKPLKIQYNPPALNFTKATLTLKTRIHGVQDERLIHIFMGESEIWLSSTAQPGAHNISSTFTKDMSNYITLFKRQQELTIKLENVLDGTLNGPISTTLTARFYYPELDVDHDQGLADGDGDLLWQQYSGQLPPDHIIAIPSGQSIEPRPAKLAKRDYVRPSPLVSKQIEPIARNVTRAVIAISATGYDSEEFWYSHLLDEYAGALNGVGGGPSRVIEVSINNRVAGFVFPYPVIFTGGISSYMWSPIVGIHAFDTPVYEIDISAFLPVLWETDARIDVRVMNGYNSTQINDGWLINANILTWETPSVNGQGYMVLNNSNTTINGTSADDKDLDNKSVGGFLPSNSSVFEVVSILKGLTRSARLNFNGHNIHLEWQQACMYDNIQYLSNRYEFHSVAQSTLCAENITMERPDNDGPSRRRTWQKMYQYPLAIQATYDQMNGRTDTELTHGYEHTNSITGASIATVQNATSSTFDKPLDSRGRMGFGSNRQLYFHQDRTKAYQRVAAAVNNTLIVDTDSRGDPIYTSSFINMPEGPAIRGDSIHMLSDKFFDTQARAMGNNWSGQYLAEVHRFFDQHRAETTDSGRSKQKTQLNQSTLGMMIHRKLIARNRHMLR
ncbi:hypothetical protein AWJ20_615 [Sugiyamaella lignohabitans]|uniref:Peptide N-acetyl-beta-D-glucosaminyl asparaginase amidase A N-terminal domain-containing protein n=1 Tax=Sugiyamaella lignohabitans TaxID=796027 RepID=A0A167D1H1_9ASCO|nr:uncharacterized protein AWJ20_615 [Sugiyamaella lignohabitans]ANB12364.1 hypothetical protein AWJ20_615 [Sugiyamaella lignohabitans]